ncbi:MAG TPA: cytochrome b/b6 domain-containing protein [Zoogloea sp.]|jgi:thiosulfate reductase cytochrome b subunit|uniref:cytochrome b/b6 domain-containing protein n=1 Tax=Zoogloea sp. TaxID=49181 RepID=UPI001B768AA4|nr:cytochrome b/b6 domain-containing protein [Zoogloea sp.]MBP6637691.1 cytochrome b/b6 domain-containing protein [Sulfuritalea sp.]HOB47575.1 cytochrome b/b6 domain-containing protein [Zoogloea sp.]HQA11282.1 cytochrome b/b6 domain-containing protein [Zoogloea sp.]HQE40375.1 cytochrome b/b6 domain-containing protein [Zoogloea sp.]
MERTYIFTRFERLWHWIQAVLIIGMLFTGFEIHGTYTVLGFQKAHTVHTASVWAFIALWVFAIFWHLTTGEWRQYIPTMKNIDRIVRYYAVGIFKGEPHPFKPTRERKHNPMQAQTYLGVTVVVTPLIWLSGLAYLFYNELNAAGYRIDLATIAFVHTLGAFLMLAFLIGHIYLGTTGHTPLAHFKAMFTGWDEAH